MTEHLITAAELAQVLQVPVPHVWTLVRQGKISSYRVGRLHRFDLAAVLEEIREGGR
jgi:excisionase family DNA binding protein